jgi:hypothetical protein
MQGERGEEGRVGFPGFKVINSKLLLTVEKFACQNFESCLVFSTRHLEEVV